MDREFPPVGPEGIIISCWKLQIILEIFVAHIFGKPPFRHDLPGLRVMRQRQTQILGSVKLSLGEHTTFQVRSVILRLPGCRLEPCHALFVIWLIQIVSQTVVVSWIRDPRLDVVCRSPNISSPSASYSPNSYQYASPLLSYCTRETGMCRGNPRSRSCFSVSLHSNLG